MSDLALRVGDLEAVLQSETALRRVFSELDCKNVSSMHQRWVNLTPDEIVELIRNLQGLTRACAVIRSLTMIPVKE